MSFFSNRPFSVFFSFLHSLFLKGAGSVRLRHTGLKPQHQPFLVLFHFSLMFPKMYCSCLNVKDNMHTVARRKKFHSQTSPCTTSEELRQKSMENSVKTTPVPWRVFVSPGSHSSHWTLELRSSRCSISCHSAFLQIYFERMHRMTGPVMIKISTLLNQLWPNHRLNFVWCWPYQVLESLIIVCFLFVCFYWHCMQPHCSQFLDDQGVNIIIWKKKGRKVGMIHFLGKKLMLNTPPPPPPQ